MTNKLVSLFQDDKKNKLGQDRSLVQVQRAPHVHSMHSEQALGICSSGSKEQIIFQIIFIVVTQWNQNMKHFPWLYCILLQKYLVVMAGYETWITRDRGSHWPFDLSSRATSIHWQKVAKLAKNCKAEAKVLIKAECFV